MNEDNEILKKAELLKKGFDLIVEQLVKNNDIEGISELADLLIVFGEKYINEIEERLKWI